MRVYVTIAALLSSTFLAGCTSAFLPAGGATVREIEQSADRRQEQGFEFFEVDDRVAEHLSGREHLYFSKKFTSSVPPPSPVIGPGDVLQVSVWEPGGSGLFGPNVSGAPASPSLGGIAQASARQATLQPLVVERDGSISIPFSGRVRVGGLSVDEARARIEDALRKNAIQPQVLLTVIGQNSHAASVGGDVGKPGAVPLSQRGDTVLDVIANAGGSKFQAYETVVRINRRQQSASMSLRAIVENPSENIYVLPGDSLFLMKRQQTFSAFGATGKAGHYPFDADHVLLAEAVAKAGGLVDSQADVGGVLLFRYETGESLAGLHPKYRKDPDQVYPTVYRVNWRTAKGILYGRRIHIHDKDVVMIANADGAQLLKFVNLLKGASSVLKDFNLIGTTSSSSTTSN
jgi:polysaccharide biosynthesis/export protein